MIFSIITPVYNRETTIGASIDSVLAQTFDQWELILVDDGSTDRTSDICKAYAQKDARICYVHKDNGGVSSARNRGIEEANGEYILFLDSDDSLTENALMDLSEQIAIHPQADVFCFGFDDWLPQDSEDKTVLSSEDILNRYIPAHIHIKSQKQDFLENYVWNKCFKTQFLNDNTLRFDEARRNQEDGIFVVNCLEIASEIVLVKKSFRIGVEADDIDHLSAKLYKDQLALYVGDETDFYYRWNTAYDFSSEYYCRSNVDVLITLCSRMARTFGNEAKTIIGGHR